MFTNSATTVVLLRNELRPATTTNSTSEMLSTYSTMTQEAVAKICLSSFHMGFTSFWRPYFLSTVKEVQTTKKRKEMPSEMVDARAYFISFQT